MRALERLEELGVEIAWDMSVEDLRVEMPAWAWRNEQVRAELKKMSDEGIFAGL